MAKSKKPPVPFFVDEDLLVDCRKRTPRKKPLRIVVTVHERAEKDILDQQYSQLFAACTDDEGLLFKPIGFIDYHPEE